MKGFELDYGRRLNALNARRTPAVTRSIDGPVINMSASRSGSIVETFTKDYYQADAQNEIYNKVKEASSIRYAIGSMQPVDPRYTEITFEEGDRVKNQLINGLKAQGIGCEYKYQGSVTSDTHIKAHSDIDLLEVTEVFYFLEPPQIPKYPYTGNSKQVISTLKQTSQELLTDKFPAANVDGSNSKAITICGGSLCRKIDVVPAVWWDTVEYSQSLDLKHRGVKILDQKNDLWIDNKPFLHNDRINARDRMFNGALRKVIRLLKSLKYDSESVALSSYAIASLAYNMDDQLLATGMFQDLQLVSKTKVYLDKLSEDKVLRESIMVPNGLHKVFANGQATVEGLNDLRTELDDLLEAIQKNLQKSFRKLEQWRMPEQLVGTKQPMIRHIYG